MSPFLRSPAYYDTRFHAKQWDAYCAFKAGMDLVLPWGRRSGKTELVCSLMEEDIEERGKPCLYVAKTRDQARDIVWPKFEAALKNNKDWRLYESSIEVLHKPSGASVKIKGVDKDADNLTGSGYRIIACDEYALWKKPDVVGRVLAPMLGDFAGQFIFPSTKRGRNHFWRRHMSALKQPNKYFVSEATMFDNTFLTDEGRAKVLSEYEGGEMNPLYQQEVLNKYVTFEGQVFALEPETYTERKWDPADFDWAYHWRGMDHGYSPDPTAAVWIAYNRRKQHFQVFSEYKQNALLIKQHSDAIRAQERWAAISSYSDVDPQVVAEYKAVGLDLTVANKSDKKARLLKLVNALRVGRLKIAHDCKRLLEEMASLSWEQVDKETGDDHLVDALDYGFNNLYLPPEPQEEPEEQWPRRTKDSSGAQTFDDFEG